MANDLELDKEFIERIRSERRMLDEQIRLAEETIKHSRELLRTLDKLLASGEKRQRN